MIIGTTMWNLLHHNTQIQHEHKTEGNNKSELLDKKSNIHMTIYINFSIHEDYNLSLV